MSGVDILPCKGTPGGVRWPNELDAGESISVPASTDLRLKLWFKSGRRGGRRSDSVKGVGDSARPLEDTADMVGGGRGQPNAKIRGG